MKEGILKATETHVLHLQVYVWQDRLLLFPSSLFSRKQHTDESSLPRQGEGDYTRCVLCNSTVYCYYREPCSLTGYSLSGYSAFKAFWLAGCMSKITPGTWKCPQRRKKTHLLQSWLPWFSKHYSLWSLGKKQHPLMGPMVSLRVCTGACWWFRLMFFQAGLKKDELGLKQPSSFRAIL